MQVPVYEFELRENPVHVEMDTDEGFYKGFLIDNDLESKPGVYVIDVAGNHFGPFKSVDKAKMAIDVFVGKMTSGRRTIHKGQTATPLGNTGFPKNKISIKPSTYRGKNGFLVYGYGPAASGIQRVFASSRKAAERIAAKLRAGQQTTSADFNENPPVPYIVGKIYQRCLEIRASKAGMPHECDEACRKAGHRYVHPYKQNACIYALSDGSVLIR